MEFRLVAQGLSDLLTGDPFATRGRSLHLTDGWSRRPGSG